MPRRTASAVLMTAACTLASVRALGEDAAETPSPVPSDLGPEAWTVRAFSENDGSIYNPAAKYDRHYTGGAGMAFLGRPHWLEGVSDALPFADIAGSVPAETRTGGGLLFVERLFTPQDITQTAPIPGDLPFAAQFYGGGFWQRETELADHPGVRVLEHVELDLGMIGPSARGHDIQLWIHTHIDGRPNPGWANQRPDEPTAQLLLRRKWVLDQTFFGAQRQRDYQWELIPDAAANLGTLEDSVAVGCEGRVGVNLPRDFGTPRMDDPGTPGCDWRGTLPDGGPRRGDSFYLFARGEAKLVAHDTFVDGSFFHADPAGTGFIHGNHFRSGLSAGFRWCWDLGRTKMEFGYALTVLSPAFREQKGADTYGSFRFGTTFRF